MDELLDEELGGPYEDEEYWGELVPDTVADFPSVADILLPDDFPIASEPDPNAEIIVLVMPEAEDGPAEPVGSGGGFFGGRRDEFSALLDETPQA